jgi:type IV pilus assembly protein PilQ
MKYSQPRSMFWLMILISLALLMHGCAAKSPTAGNQQAPSVVINKIESRDVDGTTEIAIEGTEPILQYTSFQLTEPLRLVVDISDADVKKFQDKISVNKGAILDITPSQMDSIARLEIALSQAVDTKLYQASGKLIIEVAKPVEVAKTEPEAVKPVPQPEPPKGEQVLAAEKLAEEKPAVEKPEKGTATVVTAVKATAGKGGVKVVISANGTMVPSTFMVEGKKLVVDIPGTRSKVKPSVIPVRKGGLDRVRVGQHAAPDQKVRVVLDLIRPMEYEAKSEGNTFIIAMTPAAAPAPKAEEKAPQEMAAPVEQQKAPTAEKEVTPPAPEAAAPALAPVPTAPARRAEARRPEPAATEASALIGGGKYAGRRISLDLQDADLVNVLRLFAEVANLNMILSPDVKGKVTVRMVNIPWDQAMDIILRMNGLGYALEDNILRIGSVAALTKEAEDESKAKEAKKKAEDLITRILAINYAKAKEIEPTLKKSLSARGESVVDERTNTIIIKDIPRNVDEVATLVKVLDKPIAQVMIEARIIEASTNFTRDIGVQWGGTSKHDAAHGNPTSFNFPNSITVTGGPTMGTTPSSSGNFFVNLPAAVAQGSGGAIGFTFGSLNKALNLDLILSAMESTGEGKVISSPRVSALDNKEAKIEQGQSIPYQTTSATGTQVQFIDALLRLTVTPHVTPDNKIFMKIQATKNAPDTSLLGAGGQPSIRKNEATTEILLSDGETAVIGGILTIDRGYTEQKVPFFADIPLIGWLFKERSSRDNKTELIIFITPKVVKQEAI